LDGEVLADSTDIVATLERRWPEPPLYPADPLERERALALEDFFDEELGPYVRRLVMHHTLQSPGLFLSTFVPDFPGWRRKVALAIFPLIRRRIVADFDIREAAVRTAFAKIAEAGERLREELQPSGYLCGERFSVADLTLAAITSPAVAPEQFPYPQPQRGHPLMDPLREALADAGILDFAHEMYARHRGASTEVREPAYSS
jgi:glutathione S-transferase